MSDDVMYRSTIRVERDRGPNRRAYLPAREDPVQFGVHSAVAEHYGVDTEEFGATPTTIDYMVSSAAG